MEPATALPEIVGVAPVMGTPTRGGVETIGDLTVERGMMTRGVPVAGAFVRPATGVLLR